MRSPGLTPLRSGVTGGLIELTVALAIQENLAIWRILLVASSAATL
jgi:hypothetical protein